LTVFASIVAMVLAADAAAAQRYDCVLKPGNRTGLVMSAMQFVLHPDTGIATVEDPLIDHVLGHPAQAKLSQNPSGVHWLRWWVEDVPVTTTRTGENLETSRKKHTTKIYYQAWLNSKTGQVKVRARTGSRRGSIALKGRCTLTG
jgi:hypothetical protein